MESGNERLFRVIGDVGSDLVDTAEKKVFSRSIWQKLLPLAACLLLFLGLGYLALPYLTPASQETAPMLQQPAETPAAPAPEEPPQAEPAEESNRGSAGWVTSREQIVFWDTVYYVEAEYTPEQAQAVLGDLLGVVEQADDETCVGAPVYMRLKAATKQDYKERNVPLEIFIQTGERYLYCLTYYDTVGPLMEFENVQAQWHYGRLDTLMEAFVTPMELSIYSKLMILDYRDAETLSPEQLLQVFLVSLEMERSAGKRSEDLNRYLWHNGERYVIPVDDIRRQLDRYLEHYHWQPEAFSGYNATTNAVELDSLEVILHSDYQVSSGMYLTLAPEHCSLDEENRRLTLVVQRYEGTELLDERCYRIRFEQDKCVFESIYTMEEAE